MHDYAFIVHLDRVPSDEEADRIYEAGLDDGNIEDGNGRASISVARSAESLDEAILSVLENVHAAGFLAVSIANEDLVGLPTIARRLGISHEWARLLATGARGPGGFPQPITGNLFSWAAVRNWYANYQGVSADVDVEADTLAAADLMVRARMLRPDLGRLVKVLM